jgi:hypothetical protein
VSQHTTMPLKIATPTGKSMSSAEPVKGWYEMISQPDYQPPLPIPHENHHCTCTRHRFSLQTAPRHATLPSLCVILRLRIFTTCRKESHEQTTKNKGGGGREGEEGGGDKGEKDRMKRRKNRGVNAEK